jgi:hypothetical protein
MTTLTITVRIVPCDCTRATSDAPATPTLDCRRCDGRGQVVATTERLLVGLVLAWDRFR